MLWPHADNPSGTRGKQMKREIIIVEIFGRPERCRVLARHGRYTIDVERMRDGKCFRVSGLTS